MLGTGAVAAVTLMTPGCGRPRGRPSCFVRHWSPGRHVPLIWLPYPDSLGTIHLGHHPHHPHHPSGGFTMADIAAVLGRLTQDELNELRSLGPSGHLTRRLTDAIDRAAGGPGAGRGYYVPNGSVSSTGGPHVVLRSDVSGWLFGPPQQA